MNEVVQEYYDIPYRKKGRPSKRPNSKELSELWAKHTINEIAVHYGVAVPTVYSWIAAYRKEYRAHAKQE